MKLEKKYHAMESDDDLINDLLYATVSRDVHKVDKLMQYGIDPCTPTKDGTSPIHKAAIIESPSGANIISKMLSYGADPNVTTPTGLSPLHIAAMWGRVDTIDVLLDSGADVSLKDIDDMSALDYTDEAEEKREECIDALTRYRSPVRNADPPCEYYGDISENNATDSVSETTFEDCFSSSPVTPKLSSRSSSLKKNRSFKNSPAHTPRQQKLNSPRLKTSCRNSRHSMSETALNDCSWSPPTTPKLCSRSSSLKKDRSFKNSPLCTPTGQKSNSIRLKTSSRNSQLDESVYKDCKCCKSPSRSAKSSLFVPISPQGKSRSCEVLLKISVINGSEDDSQPDDKSISQDSAFENDFDAIHYNEDQSDKENVPDELPPFENADNFLDHNDDEIIENLSNILTLEDDNTCDTYINLDDQNPTIDCDSTVDYSSKPFLELVQNYEERKDEVDAPANGVIEEKMLNSSKMNNTSDVKLNTLNTKLLPKQEGVIEELAKVNVEYDWKDISDISTVVSEFEDSFVIVPGSISSLSDQELRKRLLKAGETPGPISDTTRKLYQKYLVKLEKNNYRPLKSNDKYKDYSPEMRQVLSGAMQLDNVKEDGSLLELEMSLKFTHPEKYTWREGWMKTSFNYILLDPRVLNNLPERGKTMSTLEKLRIFLASIFYIGKGKKSRPYDHLYDAIKIGKDDTGLRPVTNKLKMIFEIWADGHGVVSLHIFHSVIPVEAFTREACMIEAMGLARLTNAKSGDFYGDAASWNGKKRRQLGIYILYKAMEIYLLDGERQIRQIDLVKPS